jgi:hypothetical protein
MLGLADQLAPPGPTLQPPERQPLQLIAVTLPLARGRVAAIKEETMLHKLTRVDLIEAHGVMCEKIMDNDIAPFVNCEPVPIELRARAHQLDEMLRAVSDYAMIVVDDTFAHLGFNSIYARNYVGAIREASEAINKLLMAHAAKLGERGQPDPAA